MKKKRVVKTRVKPASAPEIGTGAEDASHSTTASSVGHFIVGVGASAGGLEALGKLFAEMPVDSGLSFVVVQHLSPDYKSFMVELLSKRTAMPVLRAEDGLEVTPNHVYLIPPRKNLKIFNGRLTLLDPDLSRGFNLPIDIFFRSLAEERQHQAIGIVLSGTGSDGTMGIRAIKDAGGMVVVQSEATAQFDGMPRSAIGTGLADFILPPEEMPGQLISYLKHPFVVKQEASLRNQSSSDSLMHKIFHVLRDKCGTDFSFYKPSVIDRRIARRISINQLNNLEEYFRYLQTSPREATVLFNELLICVTRFFRDREAFDFLQKTVFPDLLKRAPTGEGLRVWVPSCSTGEEAYSLAMLFMEEMRKLDRSWPIKIFATDISRAAIETASLGLYSESEVADVPPDMLKRYFTRRPEGWQVNQALRQMVVFARHDLLKDPPFTKLDLVSCRNVLIYFQPALQSRVINLFHFALKPEGVLFLGNSETVGEQTDKFHTISARYKVYQTRLTSRALAVDLRQPGSDRPWQPETVRLTRPQPAGDLRLLETVYQEVIADYAPACMVVDENNEIVHLLGEAGEYLYPPAGAFTRNILKLTGRNLSVSLATLLHRVSRDGREHAVDNVRFRHGKKLRMVRLRVRPLRPKERSGAGLRLVFLEPKAAPKITRNEVLELKADHAVTQRISDLEQELVYNKETLQATIEELETANEELQATNEELLASNEELQSTNEELQSLNEELHTVNTENQNRIEELTALSNDINNLMASARVGTILVDAHLRIRRISAGLHTLAQIRPGDIGAPLEVLSRELHAPEIIDLAQRVTETDQTLEHMVVRGDGRSILVRLVPYKTETNATSGLVVTLIDLTETRAREAMVQSLIDAMPAHVAVVDEKGVIRYVNKPWTRFGKSNGCSGKVGQVGDNYFEVCRRSAEQAPGAADCLKGLLAVMEGRLPSFEQEYPCHSRDEERWFLVTANPMTGTTRGLVIAHFNITLRKRHEERFRRWAALFHSARQAIIGCDLDGVIQSWNRGAQSLFGWSEVESEGRSLWDLTPPEHRQAQREAHARAAQGNALPCHTAYRLTRRGLARVAVKISPTIDDTGRTIGTCEVLCECEAEPGCSCNPEPSSTAATRAGTIISPGALRP